VKPYFEEAGITIWHGDCRQILPALGVFDALVTDPPYGIDWAGEPTKWRRIAGHAAEDWDVGRPDFVRAILAHGRYQIVWGGQYFELPVSRGWLCWIKPDAPPSMSTFELAWTNLDRISAHIVHSISETNPERDGHPSQKPMNVMKWAIARLPMIGTLVDPFAGSGTTLEAAKQMGIDATGIETEERYCEVAANRLRQGVLDFPAEKALC
jgi:site-specific DNA-methyltransferase (adenine-specific)